VPFPAAIRVVAATVEPTPAEGDDA